MSESVAATAITLGKAVAENVVRNRASRVAFPATWCAIMAAEAIAAARVPSANLRGATKEKCNGPP